VEDLVQNEASTVGTRCGNNPNVRLTDGDRKAVEDLRAYLKRRRAAEADPEDYPEDQPCTATYREEPMPDTVYCGERGYHQRHTSGSGGEYYAWLDGDEGAGWDR
jgi:hypothetical protein